jgi:hypothetical protein
VGHVSEALRRFGIIIIVPEAASISGTDPLDGHEGDALEFWERLAWFPTVDDRTEGGNCFPAADERMNGGHGTLPVHEDLRDDTLPVFNGGTIRPE